MVVGPAYFNYDKCKAKSTPTISVTNIDYDGVTLNGGTLANVNVEYDPVSYNWKTVQATRFVSTTAIATPRWIHIRLRVFIIPSRVQWAIQVAAVTATSVLSCNRQPVVWITTVISKAAIQCLTAAVPARLQHRRCAVVHICAICAKTMNIQPWPATER